ncbi:hypothetical protein [Streptomyces sp. NPDC018584]|uniref:hypothetical protein n=1 Tax=unclassified Streptomyces TaxID=2593676 RepID=UPI0037958080
MRHEPKTLYTAFGEAKGLTEWSRDSRCKVSLATLRKRVKKEGMPLEEAMTLGAKSMKGPRGKRKTYSAFGQSRTIAGWARDKRCQVTVHVLRYRIAFDWPVEEAITYPPNKRLEQEMHSAFGEEKDLWEWGVDDRCVVDQDTLRDRVVHKEWPLEKALTVIRVPKKPRTPGSGPDSKRETAE